MKNIKNIIYIYISINHKYVRYGHIFKISKTNTIKQMGAQYKIFKKKYNSTVTFIRETIHRSGIPLRPVHFYHSSDTEVPCRSNI